MSIKINQNFSETEKYEKKNRDSFQRCCKIAMHAFPYIELFSISYIELFMRCAI